MWLMTLSGFFSIVEKPEDKAADTLMVRYRVRSDLEDLKRLYLPEMTEIQEGGGTDYRFRAQVQRADLATAMASMIGDLHYRNFKDEVLKTQGPRRAHIYHDDWSSLHPLQES